MKDVRASVALLQLRPKAASNDCLVVCCLYSPAYLVRALWLLGVWPRDTVQPGTFRNAQPGLVWGRQIFALLADISARASARLDAGSFLSGGHEIGVRFRALCSLKKSNFCTLSSQLVSAWFQWVAQKLRRRLRTPAHSLSVRIM